MATTISQSAKRYRERRGLRETRRRPIPRYSTGVNRVHSYPVTPPLPDPRYLYGTPPLSDAFLADIWPHGVAGEQILDE